MATSNIEIVEIGIPGPPGAGVSSAEKATFVTYTGANTFTNANEFRKTSADAVTFRDDSGIDTARVNTSANRLSMANGADLNGYSDSYATEKWSIDGATGDIQTDGTLTVDGHVIAGEWLNFSFRSYEGGSVLTTGIKDFCYVPYNCVIESDGTAAWKVDVDPSGSISWDIWYHATTWPTSSNRISGTVGTQNPRVTTAASASSTSLTGWTTTLAKGGIIVVSIAGTPATATRALLRLHVRKTT